MNKEEQSVPLIRPEPNPRPPLEELLDINRAAKILGISAKTLRDHVLNRRIEYVKLRGRVLFRPDKLWELIERNTVPALSH